MWRETEARIAEQNRLADSRSDTCRCLTPVKGPMYMTIVRCTKCAGVIR